MEFSCPVEVEDGIKVARMSVKEEFIPLEGEFITDFADLLDTAGSGQFTQSRQRMKQLCSLLDLDTISPGAGYQ